MTDEHSRSMTGRESSMRNEERPVSISARAQEPPLHSSSDSFPAQEWHARFPGRNRRGNLTAISDAGEAGSSSGFRPAHSVELHIEELVLHGFASNDRYRIGDALERELTRLVTEQGVPPVISQGVEVARLNAGAFQVKTGSNPETTGVQLAQAIYRGLGK